MTCPIHRDAITKHTVIPTKQWPHFTMAQDGFRALDNDRGNTKYLVVCHKLSRPEAKHLKMPVKGELIFFSAQVGSERLQPASKA